MPGASVSVRRRDLERLLGRAERSIALLERCRPLNAVVAQTELVASWRRGEPTAPDWQYASVPDLGGLRAGLQAMVDKLAQAGPWGALYAARAAELYTEAAVAEALERESFRELAALRFPVGAGPDAERAERWALEWTREPAGSGSPTTPSDDDRDPASLFSAMRRAVGERRLPFRVLLSEDLPSAAATGDGVILVKAGARYRALDVQRIVLHEIEGHALPRLRARHERLGLYRIGSAGGSDDEEGRALLLERRGGYMDQERSAELGWRHLAALSLRRGADYVETARLLLERHAPLEEALRITSRVYRGGGLGRELVYLTALSRVERALSRDSALESFMERGRIAASAARVLRDLGDPPELLDGSLGWLGADGLPA